MEIAAGTNPFNLFQSWFDEAVAAEINDPDAIALASVNADGMPGSHGAIATMVGRWVFVFHKL